MGSAFDVVLVVLVESAIINIVYIVVVKEVVEAVVEDIRVEVVVVRELTEGVG